ncbi:Lectin, galactoside-binding, soluble, 8 [Dermatophagoides pteronyssinus]|uniref:Galectin-8-like n=2 Tax=Dermatophagoides pteronyssinus TaxID=6956 RepID=A0A6P6XYI4_DERPT|nr:galectin-8-like [Dermatophagoides pteronyssinus]KAH9424925.1 Lectin, galactoside-binding, soluble, 8 [Dermatophagoides pteronyssinus]
MHRFIQNPALPACLAITNDELLPGSKIVINGQCRMDVHRGDVDSFRIDLFDGQCEHLGYSKNIAFHFNPRFRGPNHGSIAMNSYRQGNWEHHIENEYQFPFRAGQRFTIELQCQSDQFQIKVDGSYIYQFKHRYDYRRIGRMHIDGRLTIDSIRFETIRSQPQWPVYPPTPRSVMCPTIPYFDYDIRLSQQPVEVFLAGKIDTFPREYIQINLVNSERNRYWNGNGIVNIPVHFSIRPFQREIVRNTLTAGIWGAEEKHLYSGYSLNPGCRFDMMIRVDRHQVSVAINGQSAFEYRHRHSPNSIDALQVTGSIYLEHIRFQNYS